MARIKYTKGLYVSPKKTREKGPLFLGAPSLRRLRLAKDPKQKIDLFFSFHQPAIFKGFGSEWMPTS